MEEYHTGIAAAQGIREALGRYVGGVLERLDEKIDKRLVGTFLALLGAMLVHRHRENGLLLSE